MHDLRRTFVAFLGAGALIGAAVLQSITSAPDAAAAPTLVTSSVRASDGQVFTATNHLVQDTPAIAAAKRALVESARNSTDPTTKHLVGGDGKIRHEYLVVWAGDANAGDNSSATVPNTPLERRPGEPAGHRP